MALTGTNTPKDERDSWRTPLLVYEELNARYGPFTLDAAADETNHKCAIWLGPGGVHEDALAPNASWIAVLDRTKVFCNPPYSRGMVPAFVTKAKEEADKGFCIPTLLLPATTDTLWWHTHVWDNQRGRFRPGVEVEFWPRRIPFVRPDGTAGANPPGGSVIVTFYG